MKQIILRKSGNRMEHGLGNEVGGYGGGCDCGWSYKLAERVELRNIQVGEEYELIINGKSKGIKTKGEGLDDNS